MKTTTLALILFLTALNLWAQTPPVPRPPSPAPPAPAPETVAPPSSTGGAPAEKEVAGYNYNWTSVDINQALTEYSKLVGRTLLRAAPLTGTIILETQSPLTKTEAIEALQAVFALNGVSVINVGEKFVKVLPVDQANSAGAEFNTAEAGQLPELGTYVTRIVQLQFVKPSEILPAITPFAKLANSIVPIENNGILVLRDNAENVKRMLEMIQQIDVAVPAEIISEVIPIRYAMADDIANALNSLGGGGGSAAIGGSAAKAPASGFARPAGTTGVPGAPGSTGLNSLNQPGTARVGAQATVNGTPSPTGVTTFQQRIQTLLQNATGGGQGGGSQPIQILGQTKIIADERSNSLLIFATRQDMDTITNIVSKLDVLLSQVLIEAVIIDYSLGPNTFNFGVSAAQNPQNFSPSVPAVGGGGFNNGPSLINSLNSLSTTSSNASTFASSLGGGLSYFGNIGKNWDVALQAAETDSHASIIQRPRIQTSQAKAAQFFVGETVPYVTSTYNYGGINGNQSSYSQLSVGVELDVTPFINPDGLVVMDINQEIDDLDGSTQISGVGLVPNTDKRTLSSEIAVINGETVMLGGFIKNQKMTSRAGVPFLDKIPLLGNLFSSRSDSKQREELIVLMRPTVLKSPEIAAANTIKEEQRLPGVSAAEAENEADERKQIEAEQKLESKRAKLPGHTGGFYNPSLETGTNNPAPSNPNSVLLPAPTH
jgi:general secretion pathway protein D